MPVHIPVKRLLKSFRPYAVTTRKPRDSVVCIIYSVCRGVLRLPRAASSKIF